MENFLKARSLFVTVKYLHVSAVGYHVPSAENKERKLVPGFYSRAASSSSSHHLSLYHEGRWGTKDDFATSFLHFSLFSTAFWKLPNSRPVHSLMSSHLFLCVPCLLPPFTVPCRMVLARSDERDHTIAVCVSLRWSGSLRVVRLPAGSWHRLSCW